jgi:hypothetical protein
MLTSQNLLRSRTVAITVPVVSIAAFLVELAFGHPHGGAAVLSVVALLTGLLGLALRSFPRRCSRCQRRAPGRTYALEYPDGRAEHSVCGSCAGLPRAAGRGVR